MTQDREAAMIEQLGECLLIILLELEVLIQEFLLLFLVLEF